MIKKLDDIVIIEKAKNGKINISYDLERETNIYNFLRLNGFCTSKLDNKRIYYQRKNKEIKDVSITDIRFFFINYLREKTFEKTESTDYSEEVLDWFLKKQRIHRNKLLIKCLQDDLSENEIHHYKLKTNLTYKSKYENKKIIEKLKEFSFKKCSDLTTNNNLLYYKKIKKDKYLIIVHFNHKDVCNSVFDCKISKYNYENEIGKKLPIEENNIILNFTLNDITSIEKYI